VGYRVEAERKAHGYSYGGGEITGQRTVNANVHEGVAVGKL
jgi:hypothetical protein